MFVGHLAVALFSKRIAPRLSLGTLVLATMLADFLCFILLIAGVERFALVPGAAQNRFVGHYIAYSHSLLMDLVWAALFAAAYFWRRRYPRGAWILFAAVLSHWVLDFVSHRPDMQLAPGSGAVFGLGLWNSLPLTLVAEGGFWLAAAIVYVRATQTHNRRGVYAFWPATVLLTLAWYKNITAGIVPDPVKAGISGLVFFSLTVVWAYWMERVSRAQSVLPA